MDKAEIARNNGGWYIYFGDGTYLHSGGLRANWIMNVDPRPGYYATKELAEEALHDYSNPIKKLYKALKEMR